MVMEYTPGGDLFYHIKSKGKFTENEARVILAEILEGLTYLHSLGVIYRDLKVNSIFKKIYPKYTLNFT